MPKYSTGLSLSDASALCAGCLEDLIDKDTNNINVGEKCVKLQQEWLVN